MQLPPLPPNFKPPWRNQQTRSFQKRDLAGASPAGGTILGPWRNSIRARLRSEILGVQIPPGVPSLKKKKLEVKWFRWPSGKKPVLVEVRHFVLPFVLMKDRMDESGYNAEQTKAQKRLEEAALLARWRRKHQPTTEGSRSAGRPGAACKRSSGKSRRASR